MRRWRLDTAPRGRRAGVTMTDVARRAGVSTMTVSNVINGRSQRVSEPTKRRGVSGNAALGHPVKLTAPHPRMGADRGGRAGRAGVRAGVLRRAGRAAGGPLRGARAAAGDGADAWEPVGGAGCADRGAA